MRPRGAEPLHVLFVANHWQVPDTAPATAVFVDRQIESLRIAGVRVSTFDVGTSHSPFRLLQQCWRLRRTTRALEPDLLHAQYGTLVAFLSVLAGSPVVITFSGSDLLRGASVSWVRVTLGLLLSNLATLRADALICVSEQLRQALWWRRETAAIIPRGVDLALFRPGSRRRARESIGWNPDQPVAILNAARDPANKGLALAESAMERVRASLPEARLEILSGIEPDRMPLYYQAADLLISASRQEGSPNVIKEALACNLPVVSTAVGDARERLDHVAPSAIVASRAEDLAEAILPILSSPTRSNGRQRVQDLEIGKVAERILRVYAKVLGRDA